MVENAVGDAFWQGMPNIAWRRALEPLPNRLPDRRLEIICPQSAIVVHHEVADPHLNVAGAHAVPPGRLPMLRSSFANSARAAAISID